MLKAEVLMRFENEKMSLGNEADTRAILAEGHAALEQWDEALKLIGRAVELTKTLLGGDAASDVAADAIAIYLISQVDLANRAGERKLAVQAADELSTMLKQLKADWYLSMANRPLAQAYYNQGKFQDILIGLRYSGYSPDTEYRLRTLSGRRQPALLWSTS